MCLANLSAPKSWPHLRASKNAHREICVYNLDWIFGFLACRMTSGLKGFLFPRQFYRLGNSCFSDLPNYSALPWEKLDDLESPLMIVQCPSWRNVAVSAQAGPAACPHDSEMLHVVSLLSPPPGDWFKLFELTDLHECPWSRSLSTCCWKFPDCSHPFGDFLCVNF